MAAGSSHRFDPREALRAATGLARGSKVRIRRHHPQVRRGQQGEIKEVRRGTYYAVAVRGGLAYVPAEHCDPDDDHDTDTGTGDTDGDTTGPGAVGTA